MTRTTPAYRHALPLLALLVASTLAGCLGDQADPEPASTPNGLAGIVNGTDDAPEDGDPATTGTVRIEVVNPSLEPIAGAKVAVAGRTGLTGDDGFATLDRVRQGTHNLSANKDGYREAIAEVTVIPGDTATTRVKLLPEFLAPATPPPPENQSYAREYDFAGVFECSLVYLIIPGDCLTIVDYTLDQPCQQPDVPDAACTDVRPGDATDEQNAFDFPLDRGWETVIVEQVWTPIIPGTKMQVALEPAEYDEQGHAPKYARVYGENPLYIRLENGVVHETAEASVEGADPGMPNPAGGEVITSRSFIIGEGHNAGGLGFLGVGFAYGQRFDVYVTVFYGEPAPEGFTRAPE